MSVENPASVAIASGTGTYSFGSQAVSTSGSALTFTIKNTGGAVLNLTGTPKIAVSGTNLAEFTVVQTATTTPVAATTGSTTFTIAFSPNATAGLKTATIEIANNDNTNYTFTITGTATSASAPAMSVENPASVAIASGTGTYSFGSQTVSTSGSALTFTIKNTGGVVLNLSGSPKIAIAGTNPTEFTVNQASTAATVVATTGSTTFTIAFNPNATAGAKSATITIANDDASYPTGYTFTITGTATSASSPGYVSTPSAGSAISMTGTVGTNPSATLTVNNPGTAALSISPAIAITPATKFTVTPTTVSIGSGGSQNFTITCNGSVVGTFTAAMSVTHNAAGSPANYPLSCTVNPPITASVVINSVSNITGSTVTANGTATGAGISERGFYWWIPPTAENNFGGSESGLIPEGGNGPGNFSLNVTGLKPGNTYHIKVYVKVGGQIITSDEQLFTTATAGPTGKTSPTVSTTGCTMNADGTVTAAGQITDIGTSPVNVYGFVYAKHPSPFAGENGDTALAMWDKTPVYQSLSFTGTIRNLTPGKWYLRSYAHNDNPDSDAAQTASLSYGEDCAFTVPGDVIVPTAPGGLTATAESQTQVDLSWTDNSTDETGFKIFRNGAEVTPSPKVGANVTAFSDTGLACGTTYTYTVKAVNADGDSAATSAVTVTTPACASGSPTAPGGLSGVAKSATQVDLSWTDNSSNETGFRIFRNGVELLPSPKGGVNLTTFSDTGLACGTTYSYEVRAVNAAGDSAGTTVTVTTPSCASGSPTAPVGLTSVAKSPTQADLAWTDNSSNETGFKIYRNGVLITTTDAGVTTFSDTGLACGTTYMYEIKAVNASGDSAGTTVTVSTPACASGAPAAPGGLTATAVSQTQINLLWIDNSSDETGFRIFRNGAELLPSPKAGANVTTFSDTGVICGTTYTYTVKATNAAGDSAGVTATATTPA